MSDTVAAFLALIIAAAIVADWMVLDGLVTLVAARSLLNFAETLAVWR